MALINAPSKCSFLTELYFDNTYLGSATSFAYKFNNKRYLITNYHVVFGRSPITGKLLSSTGGIPNKIIITYYDQKFTLQKYIINIDENLKINKISYKYRNKNRYFDAVAIELDDNFEGDAINTDVFPETPLRVDVSAECFVLGYPVGLDVGKTPIWKRASIASEPDWNFDNLPIFLIDSGTKQGMSGSPVIIFSAGGTYTDVNGGTVLGEVIYKFLGIYSGRSERKKIGDCRLGNVWKENAIIALIISPTSTSSDWT